MPNAIPRIVRIVFVLAFANSVWASADLEIVIARLQREASFDLSTTGPLCEKLALYKLQERYPSKDYNILSNILYYDGLTVAGELDVLVLNKKNRMVHVIGEVKCRHNHAKAKKKANQQLARFEYYIRSQKGQKQDPRNKSCKIELSHNNKVISLACSAFSKTQYRYYHPQTQNSDDVDDIGFEMKEIDTMLTQMQRGAGLIDDYDGEL